MILSVLFILIKFDCVILFPSNKKLSKIIDSRLIKLNWIFETLDFISISEKTTV
jgi:hypothetical protein